MNRPETARYGHMLLNSDGEAYRASESHTVIYPTYNIKNPEFPCLNAIQACEIADQAIIKAMINSKKPK